MNRVIKFRRAYFNHKTDQFEGFSYWGPDYDENGIPTGFTGPSSWSNAKGKIDQQFTGLKDKNGNEIYEGDLILWEFVSNRVREVKFMDGAFYVDAGKTVNTFFSDNIESEELEVIGNIYQKRELL